MSIPLIASAGFTSEEKFVLEAIQNLHAVTVLLYDGPGKVRSAQTLRRSKREIVEKLQRVNNLLYDKDTTYPIEKFCRKRSIALFDIEQLCAKCIFDLGTTK
jgi:hypothetical protein